MKKKLIDRPPRAPAGARRGLQVRAREGREAEAKPKVDGTVYVLQKEFLVNLHDGRFAKLTAALRARARRHVGRCRPAATRRPRRRRATARWPRRPSCARSSPTT